MPEFVWYVNLADVILVVMAACFIALAALMLYIRLTGK